jgi:CRISPR-associated protein Csb2
MPSLLISVQFHDGRYHGSGEWPPSPARLFQALVAGAACGQKVSDAAVEALEWLETLDAPVIAAPRVYYGSSFRTYVPNNDLDALGGDPARIGDIRTAKTVHPRHFDAGVPLIYAWTFAENDAWRQASMICDIACSLYQLGRGVDMAWAQGEVVANAEASARLGGTGSILWRPSSGGNGMTLACPQPNSLASLVARFKRMRERFTTVGEGRKVSQHFVQPPKPSFNQVVYNSPSTFLLYDIRQGNAFAPQSFERVAALTEAIRDGAAARMAKGLPDRTDLVDRILIGRGASESDKARRLRITPLPTIGHAQAVRSIRRVLITVPPDCPIEAGDIDWAFSGLPLDLDPAIGELSDDGAILVQARDRSMLDHFSVGTGAKYRRWRTVTPAALPQRAARRRIEPERKREEAKGGVERLREQAAAELAVREALRHAGIDADLQAIRVQREPFEAKGKRAETFANVRFAKECLWHVEIALDDPVPGPILLGDGRYLGLGLMAPIPCHDGIWSLDIEDGLASHAKPLDLTRALRRAAMARVRQALGERAMLPVFFTGHESDGAQARSGTHKHLAFLFDALRERLVVVSPHILERREASSVERTHLRTLAEALEDLRELRAGRAGRLVVAAAPVAMQDDPLFVRSTIWKSQTDYRVTRHTKAESAAAALAADLLAECHRAGLPRPLIAVDKTHAKSGIGLYGRATLEFRVAVAGPILLGRDRHFGGGLFIPVLNSSERRRRPT